MTTRAWRRWTALDELTLRTCYQDGVPVRTIARQLRRTQTAIRLKQRRLHLRRCERHTLPAAAVARTMGLSCPKTVANWVGRGWLRPIGGRRARTWRFDPLALWDLCANGQTFVAWEVARITDPELRAYAAEQRALHPRWLRLQEVARRYHVTPGTVAGWVTQGRFVAEQVQRYGVVWLREDALDGFVPPCEQRRIRYACCGRRVPTGAAVPPSTHQLFCAACWPQLRVLPGGHVLRLVPPADVTTFDGTQASPTPGRRAA